LESAFLAHKRDLTQLNIDEGENGERKHHAKAGWLCAIQTLY
jgi:hypothetical protein